MTSRRRRNRHGADVRKHIVAAARAVREGVPRAHLVDRRREGALIDELFTREGVGTLVTQEAYEDVRPARIEDVGPLATLLRGPSRSRASSCAGAASASRWSSSASS